MLSILIPTYNYTCVDLVAELSQQGQALIAKYGNHTFCYEIIVADDASTDSQTVAQNEAINSIPHATYIRCSQNMGRAKIRNFLISQAHYEYLLIIDSDARVATSDFLHTYWQCRTQADIVCGSIATPTQCPTGCELRHRYESQAHHLRQLDYRRAHPYAHISTFNMMVHRPVFSVVQFDERCTEYGYEDALLGLQLQAHGFSVLHINNPLLHCGMDRSEDYLLKVETALRVLHRLGEPLHSSSALVLLYRRLQRLHLLWLLRLSYRMLRPLLRSNLLGRHPPMYLLQAYKLGYFSLL